MDIEELSKSQIVLLTLLVSFVTSIATGIVTVSLVEQAPPALTQTVNRVIERTVERVVPEGQTASAVTTEKTVIVKETDLIAEAIGKMTPSLVRVYTRGSDRVFLGLGVVIGDGGRIVTDGGILGGISNVVVALSDETELEAEVDSRAPETGLAILQTTPGNTEDEAPAFTSAVISTDEPALGQTVVALSGRAIPRIADGIVTALVPRGGGESSVIDTNISDGFLMQGSPLVDTQGNLIGVSTQVSRASAPGAFIPVASLVAAPAADGEETENTGE